MTTYAILITMAIITFSSRYAFFSNGLTFQMGPKLRKFLDFTAPAVLTAMWVPIVFMPDGTLAVDISNNYIAPALIAIVLSAITKRTLLTVAVSSTIFFVLNNYH